MSINKGLLLEIERETANTRRILDRLEDQHLNWKPHEKSMSLAELAGHIVELHNWVSKALAIDEFDLAVHYNRFIPLSVAQLKDALDSTYPENVKFITEMSDEEWSKIWTMRYGNHVIASVPKIGAIRFILQNHLIHHRGQITVYLRMLNIPVPGMYGPSADEMKA